MRLNFSVDEATSELAELQRQIAIRLQDKGPANIETLATELNAPQPKVWLALQKLRESGNRIVEIGPDGTWHLVAVYRTKKAR